MNGTGGVDRVILENRRELYETAARRFVAIAGETLGSSSRCAVALAGGSTPEGLYRLLATPEYRSRVEWDRLEFFWGDERLVPPDDPKSNYRMAQMALLEHLDLKPNQVHRIVTERMDSALAAAGYEKELHRFFCRAGHVVVPRFDLILLGLGADGHTASLFPRTRSLNETKHWTIGVTAEDVPRVSLTLPVLNAGRNVMFLVSGPEKALAAHRVLEGTVEPHEWPARGVRPPEGKLLWLLDREAGELLSKS